MPNNQTDTQTDTVIVESTDQGTAATISNIAVIPVIVETEVAVDDTVASATDQEPIEQDTTEVAVDDLDVVDEEPSIADEIPAAVKLSPLETFLSTYVKDMAPRVPMSDKLGAMNQYGLWKNIEDAINKEDYPTFQKEWNIVLNYFLEYATGAFSPLLVFRFAKDWEWAEEELDKLQKIVNLIHLTCDRTKVADGLKKIDFDLMFSSNFSDTAKQNLSQFYK